MRGLCAVHIVSFESWEVHMYKANKKTNKHVCDRQILFYVKQECISVYTMAVTSDGKLLHNATTVKVRGRKSLFLSEFCRKTWDSLQSATIVYFPTGKRGLHYRPYYEYSY